MDFLSLAQLLTGVAESISLDPAVEGQTTFCNRAFQATFQAFWVSNAPTIEWARKRSLAARRVNEAVHQSDHPAPRWFEFDQAKGFAVACGAVAQEAIELLTQESNFANALLANCTKHLRDASRDYRVDQIERDFIAKHALSARPWILRSLHIGGDRSEWIRFLEASGIPHCLGTSNGSRANHSEPLDPIEVAAYVEKLKARGERRFNVKAADRFECSIPYIKKLCSQARRLNGPHWVPTARRRP